MIRVVDRAVVDIYGKIHFLLISENEFFHEIKRDGIMWRKDKFAWNSWLDNANKDLQSRKSIGPIRGQQVVTWQSHDVYDKVMWPINIHKSQIHLIAITIIEITT